MRVPPLPPIAGVNVFGAVSTLRLREALGDLVIGTEPKHLAAPVDLDLHDISGRGVVGGRFLVPLALGQGGAHLELQGRSTASLNGVPFRRTRSTIVRLLSEDLLTQLATIGAVVFLLLGVAMAQRRR
jgi:hypothetical protein